MGDSEYNLGSMETLRHVSRREQYSNYLREAATWNLPFDEIIHQFPAYVGHMTLSRMLTIYEFYKMTRCVAGHMAEIGTYKGACSLLLAKLIRIYEPESLTLCHGFDWFEGAKSSKDDCDLVTEGAYRSDYDTLMNLISLQQLDNILKIHKLDLTKDLPEFFDRYSHLRFRLVIMDAGLYEVMKCAIPHFYDRLVPEGIMVFDHFSYELAPGEVKAISEFLPDKPVRTIPNSWMPCAYIVKD